MSKTPVKLNDIDNHSTTTHQTSQASIVIQQSYDRSMPRTQKAMMSYNTHKGHQAKKQAIKTNNERDKSLSGRASLTPMGKQQLKDSY